ncbi:glycosyltransferase [Bacillus pseudomycoides]|uniref:glycosyltransferase n=1 Tax=Bacillus pseudomycoides TaxID=64104 RepID=UPI000BF97995|nr:glycosyltransferase [Bacillus pseudomycoides]PFW88297.1 glycosyl transferase family 2 [Bacillus pseudomycoides]
MDRNGCFVGTDGEQDVKFSIIIPAHNEEKYIGRCLDSIVVASKFYKNQIEVIVVLNRCSDCTEEIAQSYHCITLQDENKNLSKIRNAGAKIARGEIIVTIDADSWMSENMLREIDKHLKTGKYIGGGVKGKFERISLGIIVSGLLLIIPLIFKYGFVSVRMFWCYRKDFEAIGGFNEDLLMAEDAEFAMRLKKYGKIHGKGFTTIKKAYMTTSCRKFDEHGDWTLVKRPQIILAYLKGTNKKYADELYYGKKKGK